MLWHSAAVWVLRSVHVHAVISRASRRNEFRCDASLWFYCFFQKERSTDVYFNRKEYFFNWWLDTKILGEDWILQIYRGFSGVPASLQFLYEVGIGNGSAGEGLWIAQIQEIRPERRISESKPIRVVNCTVAFVVFFSGCQCSLAISLRWMFAPGEKPWTPRGHTVLKPQGATLAQGNGNESK